MANSLVPNTFKPHWSNFTVKPLVNKFVNIRNLSPFACPPCTHLLAEAASKEGGGQLFICGENVCLLLLDT